MKGLLAFFALVVACCTALPNGVGLSPAMGYNSWNDFRGSITEAGIKSVVQGFMAHNLSSYGWTYVNLDDDVFIGRQSNGTLIADPHTFPSGIAALGAYIHAAGLKFGIYTDRGNLTCGRRPGSGGFEQIDANFYASCGVDYLKVSGVYFFLPSLSPHFIKKNRRTLVLLLPFMTLLLQSMERCETRSTKRAVPFIFHFVVGLIGMPLLADPLVIVGVFQAMLILGVMSCVQWTPMLPSQSMLVLDNGMILICFWEAIQHLLCT